MNRYRSQGNYTTFERKHLIVTGSTSNVERSGYLPAKNQIENLILAGRNLKEWRNSQYHYPNGEIDENDVPDPTLSSDYDMADAFQDVLVLEEKLKNQLEENSKRQSSKLKKTVVEESDDNESNVSDDTVVE
jgi:hypothetical protein